MAKTISIKRKAVAFSPVRLIVLSFAAVITTGTLLLMLPISSKSGAFTPCIDALFTATSATCVTGLVVYDTYTHWSVFGQIVILALIQVCGIGLVTFTTFFNLMLGKKLGLRSMQLAQESVSTESFADIGVLVRTVFSVTAIVELTGACLLATQLVPEYGSEGIFISMFLAISAFCNAGFDILGRQIPFISLAGHADNQMVLTVIMTLIIFGGLGFVVWHDLYQYFKTKKLILHTKIVLIVTAILIFGGALGVMAFEWNNPATLGPMDLIGKIFNSFFQSVTTRTAGFNSIDNAAMNGVTKAFSSMLMFIGAAPASTGGGIKVTTIAVILMTVLSVIMGGEDTVMLGRRVSKKVVYRSLAIVFMALMVVTTCSLIIIYSMEHAGHPVSGIDAFFESVSAFATVGLSVGISSMATFASKVALIFSMFIGRVGPVSFGLAVAIGSLTKRNVVIPDGQILVG